MSEIGARIEQAVLRVHRLKGGGLSRLDFDFRLLEPALRLEPFDLAELIVAIERAFGCSLRECALQIRTWAELVARVERHLGHVELEGIVVRDRVARLNGSNDSPD